MMGGAMAVIGVVPFFTEVLRPEENARRVPHQGYDLEFLSDISQRSTAEFSALARAFVPARCSPRTGRSSVLL
jgi:hypothetical protein